MKSYDFFKLATEVAANRTMTRFDNEVIERTAKMFNSSVDCDLSNSDVAILLACSKIARHCVNHDSANHLIDAAVYLAIASEQARSNMSLDNEVDKSTVDRLPEPTPLEVDGTDELYNPRSSAMF